MERSVSEEMSPTSRSAAMAVDRSRSEVQAGSNRCKKPRMVSVCVGGMAKCGLKHSNLLKVAATRSASVRWACGDTRAAGQTAIAVSTASRQCSSSTRARTKLRYSGCLASWYNPS